MTFTKRKKTGPRSVCVPSFVARKPEKTENSRLLLRSLPLGTTLSALAKTLRKLLADHGGRRPPASQLDGGRNCSRSNVRVLTGRRSGPLRQYGQEALAAERRDGQAGVDDGASKNVSKEAVSK